METIGRSALWSLDRAGKPINKSNTQVRRTKGVKVRSYRELARLVAELQFRNRDFVLVFRGQSKDYRNEAKNTSLRPGIFRPLQGNGTVPFGEIRRRFERLETCDRQVAELADAIFPEREIAERLRRQRILRWTLLQHYEVCPTPLLDVTHSLRVAASFAFDRASDEAFVFVLGIPNISGAVTASIEAGLQVVRLASVCPSNAVRPHIQEGYVLGEYPEIGTTEQKQNYGQFEMDFGRRLVAKFRFNPEPFWRNSPEFPPVPHEALYPAGDPLEELTRTLRPTRSMPRKKPRAKYKE